MVRIARLTSKGQITIPREVRRALRLQAGDGVVFERAEKGFQMRRLQRGGAFEIFRGIGNPGIPSGRAGVRQWARELRGR
jgi:AbrB family looped-hinge helix DNA binding protein